MNRGVANGGCGLMLSLSACLMLCNAMVSCNIVAFGVWLDGGMDTSGGGRGHIGWFTRKMQMHGDLITGVTWPLAPA
jgi:hypothetical protein